MSRALIDQHLPGSICRYRQISERELANLSAHTVWMSTPEDLNDPYEGRFVVDQSCIFTSRMRQVFEASPSWAPVRELVGVDTLRECLYSESPVRSMISALCAADLGIDEAQAEQVAEVLELAVNRELAEIEEELINFIRRGVTICSFGTDPLISPMWSHYADEHRGLCIEWDLTDRNPDYPVQSHIFPVMYAEEPLDLTPEFESTVSGAELPTLFPVAVATRKHTQWAYEQEWRLAFPVGEGAESHPYAMPKPTCVYLGARVGADDATRVGRVAAAIDVPVKQLRLNARGFNLIVDS